MAVTVTEACFNLIESLSQHTLRAPHDSPQITKIDKNQDNPCALKEPINTLQPRT
jgi:hypothetical protein